MDEIKLTPKQERFCQVYIETGNASEAYRAAYNAEKMKPESVAVCFSQAADAAFFVSVFRRPVFFKIKFY